jgi:hypothetical protein
MVRNLPKRYGSGTLFFLKISRVSYSVADPNSDPDPKDPFVFGPPESESFYHQAKIVGKTFFPTVL